MSRKQSRLKKLYSHQVTRCNTFGCNNILVSPIEIFSGWCEKCHKKQNMTYYTNPDPFLKEFAAMQKDRWKRTRSW